MPDTIRPVKPWYRSKRFWLGVASLVGGAGSVCSVVGKGNIVLTGAGLGLTALATALRLWFGERDGATAVAYPGLFGVVGDSLNRIDAARGLKAKLLQARTEITTRQAAS